MNDDETLIGRRILVLIANDEDETYPKSDRIRPGVVVRDWTGGTVNARIFLDGDSGGNGNGPDDEASDWWTSITPVPTIEELQAGTNYVLLPE